MLNIYLIRCEQHFSELAAFGGFSPFGALRHHLRPGGKRVTGFSGHCVPLQIQFPCHPAERWDYNPPRNNHLISISRRRAAKTSPSGGGAAEGGRRGAFPSGASPGLLVFYARRAVAWFSISRSEIIYSSPPKGETTHYDLCVAGAPSSTAVTDSLDFRGAGASLQIQFARATHVRCVPQGRYHNPQPVHILQRMCKSVEVGP